MFHKIFHNACHRSLIVYYRPEPPTAFVTVEEWLVTGSSRIWTFTLSFEEGGTRRKVWIYLQGANSRPRPSHYRSFTITFRHTTSGSTPLEECSTQRWDIHLIRHNTHKWQTSIPLKGFESTFPASERPHNHALDRAASEGRLALNHLFKATF